MGTKAALNPYPSALTKNNGDIWGRVFHFNSLALSFYKEGIPKRAGEAAAHARDKAAKKFRGEFARLNFPEGTESATKPPRH
jgi:hypothetical protein